MRSGVIRYAFGLVSGLMLLTAPLTASVSAQETTTIVPDITGLGVPQAAALLNQSGLWLGAQTDEQWTESAGVEPNTISAQAIAPGQSVASGTAIDVTVLRSPNVLLVYNQEMFSLINRTGAPLDITGIEFAALDGNTPASFAARQWTASLEAGSRCVQLWSVRRTGPERSAGCEGVQRWLSTVNQATHFWTGTNGVTRFRVTQNGVERAVCDSASQESGQRDCWFFVPGSGASSDATEYVYFAYTPDSLAVLNQSANQWMALGSTTVLNNNPNLPSPGHAVPIGDPELFGNPDAPGTIQQLAPGQCLLFTNSSPDAGPPQDCFVVAQMNISPDLIFWAADFQVVSSTTGKQYTCLGATEGKLTLCVMPR